MERRHKIALAAVGTLVALLILLWIARAWVAVQFAQSYFRSYGVVSSVEVGDLGLSGASGRFALGPSDAPDVSAARIELHFDPLSWLPRVVEVRLVDPVVRARVDAQGRITLPSLQAWLDSLISQPGKSRWVSDDLAISLTNLRALLATPAGAVEIDGDAKLVKNLPVSAHLTARPANIVWQGVALALKSAQVDYTPARAVIAAQFSARKDGLEARDANVTLDIAQPRWTATSSSAQSLKLHAAAASVTAGQVIQSPVLDVQASKLSMAGGDFAADVSVNGAAGFDTSALEAIRKLDAALARAVAANLARLAVTGAGHVERRAGKTVFTPSTPILVKGDKGAMLRVATPIVTASSDSINASPEIIVSGGGLPNANLALRDLVWTGGGFTANATLNTRLNFAMLRNASVNGAGAVAWQSGRFAFTPMACARVALAAFHPGASDLAKDIRASLCPDGKPLFVFDTSGWQFHAAARDATAILPLTNTKVDQVQGRLNFAGQNGAITGTVALGNARATDLAPGPRFKPLSGDGAITLANWVWRGKITARDKNKSALGAVDFTHATATGAGSAHIVADHLTFAPDHLQPEDLSPMLAALKRAEGTAHFDGTLDWTRDAITSRGTLGIDSLDFMTILGKAHAVKTTIALTSLLPPVTAPGQEITISKIDWTLPFSSVDLRFGFSADALKVDALSADWAQGHASLGAFTIKLSDLQHVSGSADLKSIALSNLIAVSNLGNKAKLEGKISGHIPFNVTPEGFRITNGRIAADGPGRLSIDRSLWAQGDAAIASNAVQDFAYQALENLAFDEMSAELNSVANGRLQIVFHIKGRSDPPKPQTADVAISDIINGTALYKPIPLPSGTPIDLTLDTSLNFDELLKSYAEAWSKTLSPGADDTHGAKP
jgi:hypothetical protein